MKIGCCTNMLARKPNMVGEEFIPLLKAIGFDYVELPLAEMMILSDADFRSLSEVVRASKIPCECCNNFFPKTMRLTGRTTDFAKTLEYVSLAFKRVRSLGAEVVVFGSGPAKQVPDGFPVSEAVLQLIELLKAISPLAAENGIQIAIEPLRKEECNIINTYSEACALATAVASENVKVLIDYYHSYCSGESPNSVLDQDPHLLKHVHFSHPIQRDCPSESNADELSDTFLSNLRKMDYQGRISIEAYVSDYEEDLKNARQYLSRRVKA